MNPPVLPHPPDARYCSSPRHTHARILSLTTMLKQVTPFKLGKLLFQTLKRLVSHCRTTSARSAPCTSRRVCCLTYCASYCAPCQPLLRAFSGWIRSPPLTQNFFFSSSSLLSSLESIDTTIYEPEIRALLRTASRLCQTLNLNQVTPHELGKLLAHAFKQRASPKVAVPSAPAGESHPLSAVHLVGSTYCGPLRST